MAEIENPWHSRPIDVHRWSDHPEVADLVDRIWDDYLPSDQTSGPKPKTAFRHQLRVLVLDLYVAWLEDPELSIGVSMSSNYWDTSSRYNAIHISKKIILIIRPLIEAGLLDVAKGSYSGPLARGNRTTRIRASEVLQGWFAEVAFRRDDVGRVEGEEIIILRGDNAEALVEYEDTDEIIRMRAELERYNQVIADAFIDIPILDEPRVDDVTTDHHHKLTRRIFSRSNFNLNGRFHGGWWQQINSDWRSKIFINDTPVVEVDFRSLHVSLLSLRAGKELDGDPYELPDILGAWLPPVLQRQFIKRLVLTAINAGSRDAAFRAFRSEYPTGHAGKTLTNEQLDKLLKGFLEKTPHIEDFLFADQGIQLMNLDGQIAERVHRYFCDQAVPVLSVHDSFIIDYTRVGELKRVMAEASAEVAGAPLPTSNKFYGLDEQADPNADHVKDYVIWRQTARSEAYLQRLAEHERRTGREVVPSEAQN
ncbi:hypothetical protein [Ruegeria sp. HKCCA0370]|uniref:hypothetical protein n=1 Tax=Ruegeria sp. HKCCA0370 TaxID=2682995 RepID=UPI0014896909|nr:hypothetical protein [Ruegeria sp. HKCCA0370]